MSAGFRCLIIGYEWFNDVNKILYNISLALAVAFFILAILIDFDKSAITLIFLLFASISSINDRLERVEDKGDKK